MIAKSKDAVIPPKIDDYLSCDDIILSFPFDYNTLEVAEKNRVTDSQKATLKFVKDFLALLYGLAIRHDVDPETISPTEYQGYVQSPSSPSITHKGVPAHVPSILIWREIAKMTNATTTLQLDYKNPINSSNSGDIYKSIIVPLKPSPLNLKFKSLDPGSGSDIKVLDVPKDMHQGLVLDCAQLMAYYYVRLVLLNDIEWKLGVNPVNDQNLVSSDPGNYMVKGNSQIFDKLVSELMNTSTSKNPWVYSLNKDKSAPFSNAGRYLIAYMDSLGFKPSKKDKSYGGNTIEGQNAYQRALGAILWPDARYNSGGSSGSIGSTVRRNYAEIKDDGYKALWKLQNNGKEITNDELLKVAKGMARAKNNLIEFYTKCFYKALGGRQEGLQSISMMTGDGSTSVGLFSIDRYAQSLFNYDYVKHNFSPIDASLESVFPLVKQVKDLKFTDDLDCKGKVQALHFNVFARDPFDIFQIKISADGVDSSFKIRELEYGLRPAPGGSNLWLDGTNLIGRFDPDTNDLKIFRNSLKSFKIELHSAFRGDDAELDSDNFVSLSAGEILLSASAYCAEQTKLFVNLEGLFLDDRFEVTTATAQNKIWNDLTVLDDFISKLAATDGSKIKADMKGGFIGKLVVPFSYDPVRQTITSPASQDQRYKKGTPIAFNNKIYVAKIDNAGDPNNSSILSSDWVLARVSLLNGQGITNYSFRTTSHVFENDKIYRIKENQQGTITTFNISQWDEIATFFDPEQEYSKNDRVLLDNEFYQALETIPKGELFNPNKWKRIPKVESDPLYDIPVGPNPTVQQAEQTGAPGDLISPLNRSIYVSVRYSFADISTTEDSVNIVIRSFASPIISNLDNRVNGAGTGEIAALANSTQLDLHTNPNYSLPFVGGRSYNGILTHLRCFGILEALSCRIKQRLQDPQFTAIQASVGAKLDALLTSGIPQSARIKTGPQYGTGISPNIPVTANEMTLEGMLPTPGNNASDVSPSIGYYEQFKNYGAPGSLADQVNYGSC